MRVDRFAMWLAATNCYVCEVAPGRVIVIDAPPGPEAVLDHLTERGATVAALLLTHGHIDHVGGVGSLVPEGVPVYLHAGDVSLALALDLQTTMIFGTDRVPGVEPYSGRFAHPAGRLTIEGAVIDVLETPGHTPGHCCYHLPEHGVLFTGDLLFAGGIGRTDLPGGDHARLMESVETRIRPLPPDTVAYPGHGPATTLAQEFASNPFLQSR